MIVVFDLDDTLYPEITYVKSAFKAVSAYLAKNYALNKDIVFEQMISILETNGRGDVFDCTLQAYNIYSKKLVNQCLGVYRTTFPEIFLPQSSTKCLIQLKNYTKYLVTDGNKIVQTNKIKALNLQKYFKKTLPTHNFGKKNAKPSTYVFHKILQWEHAKPNELVYIGDNPNKDFVNLKKEGFHTIRVLTGMFKNVFLEQKFEADYKINSLNELDEKLIQSITIQNEKQ
jgi:putative hydrolase of the HAD superfamily